MGPEIIDHKDVQIRYGYDINTDEYVAHAVIPNILAPGFPREVRQQLRSTVPGQLHTERGAVLSDVLNRMKSIIDLAVRD
jgi:hypothetical protein